MFVHFILLPKGFILILCMCLCTYVGMSVGGDKVAKKIVDLSKRNRELGAELIRLKQTIRDLQSKIMVYEVRTYACKHDFYATVCIFLHTVRMYMYGTYKCMCLTHCTYVYEVRCLT